MKIILISFIFLFSFAHAANIKIAAQPHLYVNGPYQAPDLSKSKTYSVSNTDVVNEGDHRYFKISINNNQNFIRVGIHKYNKRQPQTEEDHLYDAKINALIAFMSISDTIQMVIPASRVHDPFVNMTTELPQTGQTKKREVIERWFKNLHFYDTSTGDLIRVQKLMNDQHLSMIQILDALIRQENHRKDGGTAQSVVFINDQNRQATPSNRPMEDSNNFEEVSSR